VDLHGLATRFVPTTEIAENGYDLNIGRYIKQAAAEQENLRTLGRLWVHDRQ
jgi:type I restriction enzyme M protein